MSASKQDPVGYKMSERDYKYLEKLFKVRDKAEEQPSNSPRRQQVRKDFRYIFMILLGTMNETELS